MPKYWDSAMWLGDDIFITEWLVSVFMRHFIINKMMAWQPNACNASDLLFVSLTIIHVADCKQRRGNILKSKQ